MDCRSAGALAGRQIQSVFPAFLRSAVVAGAEPHAHLVMVAAAAKRSHSAGEVYTEAVADLEHELAAAERCSLAGVGRNRETGVSEARSRCLAATRVNPLLASRRYNSC